LLPSLTINRKQIDEFLDVLKEAIDELKGPQLAEEESNAAKGEAS
jgi:hypothetical protein